MQENRCQDAEAAEGSKITIMFDQLAVDFKVHYVHPNGTHSEATVVHIHNQETGVIDLLVNRNDHIIDSYRANTVVYREEPTAYSWHFVEPETAKENATYAGS